MGRIIQGTFHPVYDSFMGCGDLGTYRTRVIYMIQEKSLGTHRGLGAHFHGISPLLRVISSTKRLKTHYFLIRYKFFTGMEQKLFEVYRTEYFYL